MKTVTPSEHAGAELRVSDVRVSNQFVESMNALKCPLPWGSNEAEIYDADADIVCVVEFPETADEREKIAALIVVAVNTCGLVLATRVTDGGSN